MDNTKETNDAKICNELFKMLKTNNLKEEVIYEKFKNISQENNSFRDVSIIEDENMKNNVTEDKIASEVSKDGDLENKNKSTKERNLRKMFCENLKSNLDDLKPSVYYRKSLKEQLKQTGQQFLNHLYLNHPDPEYLQAVTASECNTLVSECDEINHQVVISVDVEEALTSQQQPSQPHTSSSSQQQPCQPQTSSQQQSSQPQTSSQQQPSQPQTSSQQQQATSPSQQQLATSPSQQQTQQNQVDKDENVVEIIQPQQSVLDMEVDRKDQQIIEVDREEQQIMVFSRQNLHQNDFTEINQEENKIQKDGLEKPNEPMEKKQEEEEKVLKSLECSKEPLMQNDPSKQPLPLPLPLPLPSSSSSSSSSSTPFFITSLLKDLSNEQPDLVNIIMSSNPRSLPSLLRHLNLLTHHVTLCEKVLKIKMAINK